MSKESKLKKKYTNQIKELKLALKSARDLLWMCTLLDNSDMCKKEVESIDKLLKV